LGVVSETKAIQSGERKSEIENKLGYEPSMIKITRENVKAKKAVQTAAKLKREAAKKPKKPKGKPKIPKGTGGK